MHHEQRAPLLVAHGVGVVQRRGDVGADAGAQAQIEVLSLPLSLQQLRQARPLDVLLHPEGDARVLSQLLHPGDVRVIQQRADLGLVGEHRLVHRIGDVLDLQRLDEDTSREPTGPVHPAQPGLGHAPLAELREHGVATDHHGGGVGLPRHRSALSRGSVSGGWRRHGQIQVVCSEGSGGSPPKVARFAI